MNGKHTDNLSHPVVLQVSRKNTIKFTSHAQMCLMNDTLQCYVFPFPRNHHQAIYKKL
jgi:hypothetical protein